MSDSNNSGSSGREKSDLTSKAADLVKKVITVGVGAAFLTEEGVRGLVSELKLPKELIGSILSTANETKREFFNKLSGDIIERLQSKVNPADVISELLAKNDFEFTVKIAIKPKKPAE